MNKLSRVLLASVGIVAGVGLAKAEVGPSVKVYEEPGWCVWCPSAVALPDGRYALVHSRWRESDGFEAWCAKSEVGLAISEKGALGPYRFVKTILPGSGRDGDFDRDVTHNPQVLVDGGKYYLFYMGTHSDLRDGLAAGASSSGTAKGSYRMNQRIGVAVADRIEGPYVRTGKSILPETEDCIMASNPAVVKMPNGKYLMVYKWGWPPPARYPNCRNSCAAAMADSPLGPWKVVSKDIFPVRCANFPGEDPCLWLEGDVICCSIHDNGRFYAASDRALVRFESRDGVNWKNCGELFPRGRISRLERPFVLAGPEGRRLLFAASKPGSASPHSEIIAFPGVVPEPQRTFDLVVYGGTSAGIAAAVQARRMGLKDVVVLEPTTRIGGLTSGGLGQTDIGVKWAFGGIAREFYRGIRAYYNDESHWKWQKKGDYRSKGQSQTSDNEDTMWTFEPSAALSVLESWERRDGLDIRRGEWLDRGKGKVKVEGEGEQRKIDSLVTLSGKVFRAKMFVDATYEGDLMAAAGVSYAVGREANSVYGETINGVQAAWHPADFPKDWDNQIHAAVDPYVVPGDKSSGLVRGVEPEGRDAPNGAGDHRIQAYCFRVCMTDCPENRIPFGKPANYDERDYELLFRMAEAGEDLNAVNFSPMPNRKTDSNNRGGFSMDFIGANWSYPEASYAEREAIVRAHLDYQRGLLWTLANHPRIPAKTRELFSAWGTCKDEFADGLGGGWQRQLYVREARRMVGDYVMTEQDCRQTRTVPRPVALAAYGMDSHNVRRHVRDGLVRTEGDVQDHKFKRPYPVEYGSLVPRKAECANLLVPVCVSASHIAYGSIRMEPVFFALGQVAGTAAAQALAANVSVQDVDYARLRERLVRDGQVVSAVRPPAK